MNRKTLTILSILLLLIPWLIFYHDYLFFGKIYVAPTPHALTPGAEGTADIRQSYQRDRSMVLYPEWTLLHFYQKAGASPYWNPYQFSGMPMIPLSSFMDPLRFALGALLGAFFFADTLYMLAMMLRSALALIFVFLIFRHFKISSVWASAGAVAFWFNAPILVLHHRTFDPLYFWVLILWINLKLWSAPDLRSRLLWGLGLALAFAAEIYSWHLHFSMLFGMLLAIFNGAIALQKYRQDMARAAMLVTIGILVGSGVLAVTIGLFRIWAFVDLLGYSYRTVLPKDAGGMAPYIPFGILYFPYLNTFQNALSLFTQVQLHPVHPELKRIIGVFDGMRITFFPIVKTLGQIGAVYRSPLWYLILAFVFIDRKTRRQAFPFWASYLFIFVAYNSIALLSPIFGDAFPTIFKAGNWSYLIITATHTCLSVCFGFGLIGLWRLLRRCQLQPGNLRMDLRCIFASVSRKAWIRAAVILTGAMALGLGTAHIVWSAAHAQAKNALYSLVSAMYNKTAPGFLSNLIRGQYPLEHYYAKVDYLWESLHAVLVYAFLVLVPVVLLSIWILRFKDHSGRLLQTRFGLLKALSITTVLLAGYGMTYLMLGIQLHRNASYVSEKLQAGLLASGLDPEISQHTSVYFQNALETLYSPLPGICLLLLGITLLGLGMLWYALFNPHRRTLVLSTLTLLLGVEGVWVTLNREDHAPGEVLSPRADWISFLQNRIGHARYMAYGQNWEPAVKEIRRKGGSLQQVYDLSLASLAIKKYGILKPSADLLYRMEHLEGSSPLVSNDYRIFTYAASSDTLGSGLKWPDILHGRTEMAFPFYKSRSFDLLSMKYLVTRETVNDPDLSLIYDKSVKIYENTRAFPRAWLVSDIEVHPDRYYLLQKLHSPEFNPVQTVLLEKQPVNSQGTRTRYGWMPYVPARSEDWITFRKMSARQRWALEDVPEGAPPFRTAPSSGSVGLVSFAPGHIRYRVKTQSSQMLVLSEIFYPGWQVKIDGRPADIYRANYALMALPVEAGEHKVELIFNPISYAYTRRISLVALALTAGTLIALYAWPEASKKTTAEMERK